MFSVVVVVVQCVCDEVDVRVSRRCMCGKWKMDENGRVPEWTCFTLYGYVVQMGFVSAEKWSSKSEDGLQKMRMLL